MSIQEAAPIAPASPSANVPLSELKAARKTLEVELARLIVEYENRFDCRICSVRVDFERRESDKAWRTTEVSVDVEL